MSTSDLGAVTAHKAKRVREPLVMGTRARLWAHVVTQLWPHDRGLGELRWASVTVAIMATLGALAMLIDPVSRDFVRLLIVAVPAAMLLAVAAWGGWSRRLARSPAMRLSLGPFVLLVAVVGAGISDIETLRIPAAAPLIVLAMAYAALTPGFRIAAALMLGISAIVLIGHWQYTQGLGIRSGPTAEFVVRVVVVLMASAGMAGVLRVATKAETRAQRLASRRRERLNALETLNRIIARFDGSQSVPEVIQDVVDDIARSFEIPLVAMYLPIAGDRLTLVGVAGYDDAFHEIEIGVGIIGRAAATRQTQFVADVLADPDYRAARTDVRSEVAAPVVYGDELLGVIDFDGTAERPIGPAQVALAEMAVNGLSAALRSARLDDERRDRLRAIERVLAVSREVVADLDRPRLVASVVDVVGELLTADVVALISRGADGVYRVEDGRGFPREAIGMEIKSGQGLAGRCIAERARMVATQDVAVWPAEYRAARPGGDTPHAGLAVPILVDGELSAVLVASRIGAQRRYSDLELGIADLLSAQVAIALRNADLHARVAKSAIRDPLTGLLNRRFFDEAVETAHASAVRNRTPLSLIVFDLDRFSDVNNRYGHALGNSVLRRVGRAIRGASRDGDIVVRYGGEEFVVIAPVTDDAGAVEAAERIRAAIAAAALEPVDGYVVPITASAGVACLVDEPDGRGLFRAANSALLAAKRAGRNRVTRI